MRWKTGRRSSNVEDRRGRRISGGGIKGGGIGIVLLALVGMYFGIDPSIILNSNLLQDGGTQQQTERVANPQEDRLADFVSVVLADTEDTWETIFREAGSTYEKPKLILFTGSVKSACGYAQSATGPFYCPADRNVYIDLGFYKELKNKLNAPGDFAQAYVVAHEIGHHVQNLLGISGKVQARRASISENDYNKLSVKLELQADCLAGVWANHANRVRNILEPGDVEEALNAASMIGDDHLQKQARGYVVPDSFTHGSSAQRVQWFRTGLQSGNINSCNTFQ
ncbi:neutral zinc metallopeptidase [Desulforhopalus sp. IMCC35007]|uniref:KPN_02809 family neutral zinc metallopeptidase n=1 Tax=Desulforhopalus sp. IMCC35007 TaxID=2569543 RepID=UPI0010ADACD0|nr:neutral zinc metallopeptidase [Desulforhopalus sp. IMCC35007]TKB11681.1 flagellar biosynthesis protein FlgM [Desulforhopalus sp. IMCC35007]